MKFTNLIGAIALVAGLSACATFGGGSSGIAADPVAAVPAELKALSARWRVADVRVNVPEELSVSEANRYYPVADIVWREDPYGDRRAQVAKIVDDGMTSGLTHLKGPRRVVFDVELQRFHSLTERARYSVGGVHNIIYTLTVRDAATGTALHSPIKMEIDLEAFGGDEALAAEREGLTQKVRIESHLASVMRQAFNGGQEVRVAASADAAAQ